ncbi:hypothetical protein BaRGS_00000894 [Batillaria attramentaria]|uniref:Uncharacterized protein n=1 Tax=Batillaria attramentaria TaxID=370345 RepID=A0ABD0M7X0_9CAEN
MHCQCHNGCTANIMMHALPVSQCTASVIMDALPVSKNTEEGCTCPWSFSSAPRTIAHCLKVVTVSICEEDPQTTPVASGCSLLVLTTASNDRALCASLEKTTRSGRFYKRRDRLHFAKLHFFKHRPLCSVSRLFPNKSPYCSVPCQTRRLLQSQPTRVP